MFFNNIKGKSLSNSLQEAIEVLQKEFNCEVKFIDEGEFEE